MQIHDVSVSIGSATPTYPGDPVISFEQWAAIQKGDPANVTMLHFGAHTGTHVDAPAHFIAGAPGVKSMQLDLLIGQARVVVLPNNVMAITASHVNDLNLKSATRVLFKTRNSAFWGNTEHGFRSDYTYIEPDAARSLVKMGIRLVGIDYLSVEKFGSRQFETHTILLERGVVIVEGLDLRAVKEGDYELICLPLKLADGLGDGAPARAILRSIM